MRFSPTSSGATRAIPRAQPRHCAPPTTPSYVDTTHLGVEAAFAEALRIVEVARIRA